ncbi:dUTP diphosphatase [Litchfieldia salsa]|uniref:Dimeric dUTPase, all-alpha-NTP-PPase (MazG) superfamily n=1 Tax=Litchfieldia salsa TaxID=930152 RepID=A0A1H0NZV0_9BACI|nr:dUTP diphosphatase [Litchfieldia salsa]SDO98191.1 Dimeric dUTPase, all-alpha-NTP-PPase (MazG) superfamily [Litchfieldia salsa]
MNLTKLFDLQAELDFEIENKHDLISEDLVDKKVLALLVEVGELVNEIRFFKYWSIKPPSSRETILEEYVDGFHFILSLGLDLGFDSSINLFTINSGNDFTQQFIVVYNIILQFSKTRATEDYKALFSNYLLLGEMLGYSDKEIEEAYLLKNKLNHERQEQGY